MNPNTTKLLRTISWQAARKGFRVYLVGGVVRDFFLRRKNFDLDVVVEGDGPALARALGTILKFRVVIHQSFGTATIFLAKGGRLDVVSARQESYAHPGALPVVKQGTLENDLFRRDFSINAMAISLNASDFGSLVDPFGGRIDLAKGRIRVLYDNSFADDPTRILRAIRFEQRFGFHIEPATLQQLEHVLRSRVVQNVKPARYFVELNKMLMEAKPQRNLSRLKQLKAVDLIHSKLKIDLHLMGLLEQNQKRLRKNRFYSESWSPSTIYWMGLLEKTETKVADQILKKFTFSREVRKSLQQSRAFASLMKALAKSGLTPSQIFQRLSVLNSDVIIYLRLRTNQKMIRQRIDRFLKKDSNVRVEVNGADLQRLGIPPGKEMGRVLKQILFAKLDGKVRTKEEELELVWRNKQ